MNNDKERELRVDEWIWVIFIILSIFNIFGDELEKKFYREKDISSKNLSKSIFTLTVLVSFFIYVYLSYRKYQAFSRNKAEGKNTDICEMRFFASILVVIASFLYLYCQLTDKEDVNPSLV